MHCLLQDWLRFSVAFWHTFRGTGGDPFGAPTKMWPWEDGTNSVAMAKRRSKPNLNYPIIYQLVTGCSLCGTKYLLTVDTTVRANFEFIDKLGVDFWCFHDRDIAPDGKTLEVCNLSTL